MNAQRILVVEDEYVIALDIIAVLSDFGYEVAGHAFDYAHAIQFLQKGGIDLVLSDIRLNEGPDGIELAKRVQEEFELPLVFLTSHADATTLAKAKETAPQAFLVKPFNPEQLFAAIEIAFNNFVNARPKPLYAPLLEDGVFVRQGNAMKKILFNEMSILHSDRVYVEIHTVDENPVLVRESLNTWEKKLPAHFMRVHRSFIVNLERVDSLAQNSLRIKDKEIPVSRQYREELKRRLEG